MGETGLPGRPVPSTQHFILQIVWIELFTRKLNVLWYVSLSLTYMDENGSDTNEYH